MAELVQFLFIFLLPIGLVAGFLTALFGIGGFLYVVSNPEETRQLVRARFRRPPKEPRAESPKHNWRWWHEPTRPS
jgi:hypothetical protein